MAAAPTPVEALFWAMNIDAAPIIPPIGPAAAGAAAAGAPPAAAPPGAC